MTRPIVHPAVERLHIHLAVCRARRAALLCGTCSELAERAKLYATVQLAEAA